MAKIVTRRAVALPGERASKGSMDLEQVKPAKPSFSFVVLMFACALIVIFIAAVVFLGYRGRDKKHPPYSKHPTSRLVLPAAPIGPVLG